VPRVRDSTHDSGTLRTALSKASSPAWLLADRSVIFTEHNHREAGLCWSISAV